MAALCGSATPLLAQQQKHRMDERAPVLVPGQSLQQQQRVSQAYRELQTTLYDNRQIELDYQNALEEEKMARGRAEAARQVLEKSTVTYNAAKAREAAARKRYEDALSQ